MTSRMDALSFNELDIQVYWDYYLVVFLDSSVK
jgi:hypothetical protein